MLFGLLKSSKTEIEQVLSVIRTLSQL